MQRISARVFWTLKTAGFEKLSILNVGPFAWQAAQYPVRTGEEVTRQKTELSLSYAVDSRAEAP